VSLSLLQHCTCVTAGGAYLRFSLERIRFIHAMRCRPRVQSSTCLLTLRFYHYTFPGQISSTSLMDVARHTVCDFSSYLAVSQIIQYRPIRPSYYIYIYYYAEAANSGQNHTVKHNTAHSSQIKKGTYIHSN